MKKGIWSWNWNYFNTCFFFNDQNLMQKNNMFWKFVSSLYEIYSSRLKFRVIKINLYKHLKFFNITKKCSWTFPNEILKMQDTIQELNRWFFSKMYSTASFFSREYTKKEYKDTIQACFMLLVGISFVNINKADTNTDTINEPQRRNENTKAKKPWSIAKKTFQDQHTDRQ